MNSAQMGAASESSAETQVAVVVEAHPNDAQQIAGVSGEPTIVGAAGLSCSGAAEAPRANRTVPQCRN